MRFVTSQPMLDLSGQPLDGGTGAKTPLTFGSIAETALLMAFGDEASLPGAGKVTRFLLACKLHAAGISADITVEEAALIKQLVAKAYNTLVVGRIWDALDNPVTPAPTVTDAVAIATVPDASNASQDASNASQAA